MNPKFEALLHYFNSLSVAESSAPGTDKPLPNGNIEQVFNWKKISNLEGNTGATSTSNAPPIEDLVEELSDVESIKSNKAILRFNPKKFHNHEFKPLMFHPFVIAKPKSMGSEGPVPLSPKDLRDNSSVTIVTPAIIYAVKVFVGIKVRTNESRASINWKKEMVQAFSVCSNTQFTREFLESLNEEPDVLDKFEKVLPEPEHELPDEPAEQQQEDASTELLYDNFLYSPNMNADMDTSSESECNYCNNEVLSESESRIEELPSTDSEPDVEPKLDMESEIEAEAEQELTPEQELEQEKEQEIEQEKEQGPEQEVEQGPALEPEQEQQENSLLEETTPVQSILTCIPEKTSPENNKSESETLVCPEQESSPEPVPELVVEQQWYPPPREDIYSKLFGANEPEAVINERGRILGLHLEFVYRMQLRIFKNIKCRGHPEDIDPTQFPALRYAINSLNIDSLKHIVAPPAYIVPFLRRPAENIDPDTFNEWFSDIGPLITGEFHEGPEHCPRIDIDEREEMVKAYHYDLFQKGVQKGRFIRDMFKRQSSTGNPFQRLKAKYKKFLWDLKGLPLTEDSSDQYMAYAGQMHKLFYQTGINMFIDDSLVDEAVKQRWNAKHKHWYQRKASHWKAKAKRKYKEIRLLKEKRLQIKRWRQKQIERLIEENKMSKWKYAERELKYLKKLR